ncbi:MAG: TetM/TetW/TetO/TetS family tetracycline resistance ribosomal protection protein [Lachnospiraceae bacterium]|nr:TetM/TetW/TetO/TetS family tetracycline resistance ribosomal protection protein [Lachnospiraceae bacterium]
MRSERLVIGILTHVNAGKTTLSEGLLFETGAIAKQGRVDHGSAFLDTDAMERSRGITIFSKQALFRIGEKHFTLVDTPGHSDFSAEMERMLRILDAAVLVISAPDGIGGHEKTLWRLLQYYEVPTILFVNKMDQPAADREGILAQIRGELTKAAIPFQDGFSPEMQEEIASLDEKLIERFLEGEAVTEADAAGLVGERKLFPVYFGAALHMEGIRDLADGLGKFVTSKIDVPGEKHIGAAIKTDAANMRDPADSPFSATVCKITHDAGGARLTWMKVTGGVLHVRDAVGEEKVSQIRLYSGAKFETLQEAVPGQVIAAAGLTAVRAGDTLEARADGTVQIISGGSQKILTPVESSAVRILDRTDTAPLLKMLRILEEEDPDLHITFDRRSGEIRAQIMGEVQTQILTQVMCERFGVRIAFDAPSVIYKETILRAVEGVGHYEPLRHYAEVHLMLEPTGPGTGLTFEDRCPPDALDIAFRRQILKSLQDEPLVGVLTGAELTDMKISLIAGRGHEKHTEGGDFREAARRAVRQGLMMAQNVLLEPVMRIRLEVPADGIGRALNDVQQMGGTAQIGAGEASGGGLSVIEGSAPASKLAGYERTLLSYTRGEGRLSQELLCYSPCPDAERIVEESGYVWELDDENPPSSVFCQHGAGTVIPWDEVRSWMHVDTGWRPDAGEAASQEIEEDLTGAVQADPAKRQEPGPADFKADQMRRLAGEKELMEIFERTYGNIGRGLPKTEEARTFAAQKPKEWKMKPGAGEEKSYLLVDGYNIIYDWDELRELSRTDIKAARDRLTDILDGFAGMRSEQIILVFDAYRVSGGQERVYRYNNIDVVYTREAETADLYIEKTSRSLSKKYRVTVATSDALEQVIIFGTGAVRMSARGLLEEIERQNREMREKYL